ncbi:MAG: hypothetical protein IJ565_03030 [Bacilli bacterium]|nr:hypothetical protein [Bacilli bacterium]
MNNPFKPQEVKLYNYNKQDLEKNKINDITDRMHKLNGKNHEYQAGYHEKSYGDMIKRPQSYGDVIKRPDNSYSNHLPNESHYSDAGNNNGFKSN